MKFGLYRVLGNDLPMRHNPEQTEKNTKFILEQENLPEHCKSAYILNRIADEEKLWRLKKLIEKQGYSWIDIPFKRHEYEQFTLDAERAHYLTNVNSARNLAISHGITKYDVTVVLDGAAYFRADGWTPFEDLAYEFQEDAAYAIPVHRASSFEEIQSVSFEPQIRECYEFQRGYKVYGVREPYLAFRPFIDIRFKEDQIYGKADKAELLYRLGLAGVWDRFEPQLRDAALERKSKFFGTVKMAGYCIRLPDHVLPGDESNKVRSQLRSKGLVALIESLKKGS